MINRRLQDKIKFCKGFPYILRYLHLIFGLVRPLVAFGSLQTGFNSNKNAEQGSGATIESSRMNKMSKKGVNDDSNEVSNRNTG